MKLLFYLMLLFSPVLAWSIDEHGACQDLIFHCYFTPGVQKEDCLFSSSHHPFCEGTKLGETLKMRVKKKDSTCATLFDTKLNKQYKSKEETGVDFEPLINQFEKCLHGKSS